ncbi:cyclin-dependent kinase inhibitor 1C [Diretmus argenteus]
MSNVQLSSSALERLVARRTFPLHRRTSACRNLFGPVDHDEVDREIKSRLREVSERDQQRWNFNFEANTPLDGDYEWEEIPVDNTPVFFQDSVQIGKTRVVFTPVAEKKPSLDSGVQESPVLDVLDRLAGPESSSSGSSSSSSTPPRPVEVNQENRTDKLNSGKQTHRQVPCVRRKRTATTDINTTHITDFFVKRKRPAESKCNDLSACNHSKSPITVEQTPRKRIR